MTSKKLSLLIESAKKASVHAYCPYSKFKVGAAVLTKSGKIYSACNVENASYGLCSCAERNAIFNAVASGDKDIIAVAIYTPTKTPTTPCGACRQVINEFSPNAEIICCSKTGKTLKTKLDLLLPKAFGPRNLKK